MKIEMAFDFNENHLRIVGSSLGKEMASRDDMLLWAREALDTDLLNLLLRMAQGASGVQVLSPEP